MRPLCVDNFDRTWLMAFFILKTQNIEDMKLTVTIERDQTKQTKSDQED
jgi:hypothetical protein